MGNVSAIVTGVVDQEKNDKTAKESESNSTQATDLLTNKTVGNSETALS